jgi:hypothetical protein
MGFDELSTRLWRERCVLELLRFKLAEEHLILASGHHSWLDRATAEVEQVVEMLELADTEREEAPRRRWLNWPTPPLSRGTTSWRGTVSP